MRASATPTKGNAGKAWRRALCVLVASSAVVFLTATTAASAPPNAGGGGGGGKTTTTAATTTTTGGSTTTTVAATTGGGGVATPKLTAVTALSRHRTLATYDRDLDPTALQASTYAFYSTQAVNLPILGVSRASNNQAFVLTGAQQQVTYEVKKPKTSRPITFTGSSVTEPKMLSATPLSTTQILVTFSEPVGTSALQASSYQMTVQGSTTELAVTGAAAFGSSQTQVLLTTDPQQAVPYVLNIVGPIQSLTGAYFDPTALSVTLSGSTVPTGPMLLSAIPQGDYGLMLTFDSALAPSATETNRYTTTPGVTVKSATLLSNNTQVLLVTSSLYAITYTIVANVVNAAGQPVNPNFNTLAFKGSIPVNTERPKVTSAGSTGNKSVVVQFSKAMADNAVDPTHYAIVQTMVHPEVGTVGVKQAEFVDAERMSVKLTTESQAEVSYQVTAHNVTDVAGNPLADKTNVAGVIVDPTSFSFPGTPPAYIPCAPDAHTSINGVSTNTRATMTKNATATASGVAVTIGGRSAFVATASGANFVTSSVATFTAADIGKVIAGPGIPTCVDYDERVNSDADTLWDHEETRGWQITIKLGNGETQTRQVTSNLFSADTDGDGLKDHEERALNIDPRDPDTDDDGLNDYAEFNEVYSDPTVQDSDRDGLFDGLEVTFFLTSPLFDDTDGDQLKDGYEINVNRNPKVADLPQPILTLGDMRLGLNVRFTESNGTSSRELENKAFESTLTQSASKAFSRSEASSHEVATKFATETELKVGWEAGFLKGGVKSEASFAVNTETSNTNSWSSSFTADSSHATENAYTDSLSTEMEVAKDSSVTREVHGASVQIGVFLEGRGNMAFSVRNLQVAALTQDPDNPTVLKPLATLVPDSEPETGFTLGPLVATKGPIVFSNPDASPELVQELMKNPQGLVFRFSNYDIVDEAGRNFAFTSQDVNDRTARIAIDYGGLDSNGDGQGDETEILRVATGIAGRHVEDTNGDGVVDTNDRKVVFDLTGKQVGITLRDALEASGLKWYDEDQVALKVPALTQAEKLKSFSTKQVDAKDSAGNTVKVEVVHRIRGRAIDLVSPRQWYVVTPTGIDPSPMLDSRILYPGSSVSFQFVQDEDGDKLTALTEAMHGCSESTKKNEAGRNEGIDTDKDGLDDRFEVLIGWEVDTPFHRGRVRSSCTAIDSDGDALDSNFNGTIDKLDRLSDLDEAPGIIQRDANGQVLFEDGTQPGRDPFGVAEPLGLDPLAGNTYALSDPVTDPTSRDTDLDGLTDDFELTPYRNSATQESLVMSSPEHHDSDADQLTDYVERKMGSNPRVRDYASVWDSDRDGLTDAQEIADDNRNFKIDEAERLDGQGNPKGWEVVVTKMHPRTFNRGDICWDEETLIATCGPQDDAANRRIYSSKHDPDTDDDGLTDYEEFMLKTDPGCVVHDEACPQIESGSIGGNRLPDGHDTDGDRLTDDQEVKGFTLRDGSTVKTKPANVDTDNDKRSDGEEADLPGMEIIVVSVEGKAPYQAYSHPLTPDTDFDNVVDGDEMLGNRLLPGSLPGSTDPAKSDTDGDGRSDYIEIEANGSRRPLVPDLMVDVTFDGISIVEDGDEDDNTGEISYSMQLGTTSGGLNQTKVTNSDSSGNVSLSNITAGVPFDLRSQLRHGGSVSTTAALYEEIYISGTVNEIDFGAVSCAIVLPGFVSMADGPGRMPGSGIRLGYQPWDLRRKVECKNGTLFDITLHTTIRAS